MLQLNNVRIPTDAKTVKPYILKKLGISEKDLYSFSLRKRSLDSRKEPVYLCSFIIEAKNEEKLLKKKDVKPYIAADLRIEKRERTVRPLIIGNGPAGLFAACRLVEAGFKPLIFERGKRIAGREKDVECFFNGGELNEESNIQFGEGGAGTFSDAKLTTRVKDPFVKYIAETFIRFGADQRILTDAHPHIGTDEIRKVISRMNDYLLDQGAEFHFEEAVKELLIEDKKAIGVISNKGIYRGGPVILACGHSAHDTIRTLKLQGVDVEKKDIALGFRVEHPQDFLNKQQLHGKTELEAAEYFLTYQGEKGVYSFCMCPGGFVIPACSEKKTIVTNGMSYAKRDNKLANSAILIQIRQEEFADGFDYLHELEKKAYAFSDSYRALAQNIADFINGELKPLRFASSYPLGTVLYDFNQFFTKRDAEILKAALKDFDRKIPGFIEQGIMVGPETRSSSPVRIRRNADYESANIAGLYPVGEGCGYGGGIVSCALDGIRIANQLAKIY